MYPNNSFNNDPSRPNQGSNPATWNSMFGQPAPVAQPNQQIAENEQIEVVQRRHPPGYQRFYSMGPMLSALQDSIDETEKTITAQRARTYANIVNTRKAQLGVTIAKGEVPNPIDYEVNETLRWSMASASLILLHDMISGLLFLERCGMRASGPRRTRRIGSTRCLHGAQQNRTEKAHAN
jgi:hypothetical protein